MSTAAAKPATAAAPAASAAAAGGAKGGAPAKGAAPAAAAKPKKAGPGIVPPALANCPINLGRLRDANRDALAALLDVSKTPKTLVVDPKLTGPLSLTVDASFYQAHQVEKMIHFKPEMHFDTPTVIFLLRPKVFLTQQVVNSVTASLGGSISFIVCFVPRRTMFCEKILEEGNVYRRISIMELNLDIIPFDETILSFEFTDDHRERRIDGDLTTLFYVAGGIMKLQSMYGLIPNIMCLGPHARSVCEMILRMRKELPEDQSVAPEIDSIIILDRDIDMVTPMLTMLTYEGRIDEQFGIVNNSIELPYEVVVSSKEGQPEPPPNTKVRFQLNNNDRVFAEMRNMNFSAVGKALSKKAKDIDQFYKSRHDANTVCQIRDFMKKLGPTQAEHTALRVHAAVADMIGKEIKNPEHGEHLYTEQTLISGPEEEGWQDTLLEKYIATKEPLPKVLRLLILHSLTRGGFTQKELLSIKQEIVHAYGFGAMFTLDNLELLGLLRPQETKDNPFDILKKLLSLYSPNPNEETPEDITYIYSGYAPISARLVELVLTEGWASERMNAVMQIIPGEPHTITQELPRGTHYVPPTHSEAIDLGTGNPPRLAVILVVFLGGMTFGEHAALRFLSKKYHCEIIAVTTKLLTGTTLVESWMENLPVFTPSGVAQHE
ncbi:vacuolar protein sorting-associated protein 33A [Pelomyxa schiedti]|nr:vacuolar protein sorting-associated protein 33A [Pelomyxa schiedti]